MGDRWMLVRAVLLVIALVVVAVVVLRRREDHELRSIARSPKPQLTPPYSAQDIRLLQCWCYARSLGMRGSVSPVTMMRVPFKRVIVEAGPEVIPALLEATMEPGSVPEGCPSRVRSDLAVDAIMAVDEAYSTTCYAELLVRQDLPERLLRDARELLHYGPVRNMIGLAAIAADVSRPADERSKAVELAEMIMAQVERDSGQLERSARSALQDAEWKGIEASLPGLRGAAANPNLLPEFRRLIEQLERVFITAAFTEERASGEERIAEVMLGRIVRSSQTTEEHRDWAREWLGEMGR